MLKHQTYNGIALCHAETLHLQWYWTILCQSTMLAMVLNHFVSEHYNLLSYIVSQLFCLKEIEIAKRWEKNGDFI